MPWLLQVTMGTPLVPWFFRLLGARIGKGCLVGAGALITEGKQFADHMLIIGAPAKAVRPLTEEEIARLQGNADGYVQRGKLFKAQLKKIG